MARTTRSANAAAQTRGPRRATGSVSRRGVARLERGRSGAPEQPGQAQAAADPGDDAAGGQQRLGHPRPRGDVEAGERVLQAAHEADAGQQHDDVRRTTTSDGSTSRASDEAPSGEGRGDHAPGDLLVEERQPDGAASCSCIRSMAHGGDERDRAPPSGRRRGTPRRWRTSRPSRRSPTSGGGGDRWRRSGPSRCAASAELEPIGQHGRGPRGRRGSGPRSRSRAASPGGSSPRAARRAPRW